MKNLEIKLLLLKCVKVGGSGLYSVVSIPTKGFIKNEVEIGSNLALITRFTNSVIVRLIMTTKRFMSPYNWVIFPLTRPQVTNQQKKQVEQLPSNLCHVLDTSEPLKHLSNRHKQAPPKKKNYNSTFRTKAVPFRFIESVKRVILNELIQYN